MGDGREESPAELLAIGHRNSPLHRADKRNVPDPQDIVEIPGVTNPAAPERESSRSVGADRNWLGVYFKCCHVYGRMYRSADGGRYLGRCPKCLREVRATVGPGGTARRIFVAE